MTILTRQNLMRVISRAQDKKLEDKNNLAASQSSNSSDGGVTARIMQALLKFMNKDNTGVYVIMTSNDVSQLPPEFTRAGRLDATWFFSLPVEQERKAILKVHFGKRNISPFPKLLNLAVELSEGFTGAEIEQGVKNTMMKMFARYQNDGKKTITEKDIRDGLSEVIPVSKSSREKINALITYCTSRHRLASKYKPKKDKDTSADLPLNLDFNLDS